MVLLKNIVSSSGLVVGENEKGNSVFLSIPCPSAIGGMDEGDNFDVAIENLEETAKNDPGRYYFIKKVPFKCDGTFAIGYVTFVR